jgi:diguanylate cyclase (GGDEF)-like protein
VTIPVTTPTRSLIRPLSPEENDAQVILWQERARLAAAMLSAVVVLGRLALDRATDPALRALVVIALYVGATRTISVVTRRAGRVVRWMVWLSLGTDLLGVLAVAYYNVPRENYSSVLVACFAIVYFAEFHFGRRLAEGALAASVVGYLILIVPVTGAGQALHWNTELIALAVFVLVGGAFIRIYGTSRARLGEIVELFARTEEGDFTAEYPAPREAPPDSITLVGHAYNRVRAQLGHLVLTDPLSGLLNRRGLERDLAREIARAVRSGRELALLALDVDHFKRVNDTLGHLAGDAVIQEVGELLRQLKRGGDVVARTGGDEFTLLLPETGAAGAFRLASRIREVVRAHRFQAVAGRVPVTVSIGLVADRVADENVAHDLHSRADEALYAAKESGRDRVTIWNANMRAMAVSRTAENPRF